MAGGVAVIAASARLAAPIGADRKAGVDAAALLAVFDEQAGFAQAAVVTLVAATDVLGFVAKAHAVASEPFAAQNAGVVPQVVTDVGGKRLTCVFAYGAVQPVLAALRPALDVVTDAVVVSVQTEIATSTPPVISAWADAGLPAARAGGLADLLAYAACRAC